MIFNTLGINDVGWFQNLLRSFFSGIDKLIYQMVGWLLSGIFELSTLMAAPEFAQTIYRNIYIILAVFMVFKLTFSFIQYMISPDKMLDKDQGVGKLIANTIIMLIMLIMLPILFFQTYDFEQPDGSEKKQTILTAVQEGVLRTIPKIIIGIDTDANVMQTAGEQMASGMFAALCPAENDEDNFKSLYDVTDVAMKEKGSNGGYKYNYMWPLTTIAGIALLVVLIGIAVDVAVRTFKIIILQVIAPIPVMTYIDPKSSKDGAFNSWLKNFISTFVDLFVKIGSVYVLLLLIQKLKLFDKTATDGIFGDKLGQISGMPGTFVKVMLVIGLFKFAKDAPKFIKDAMGIKDNGGGGLFGGLATLGAAAGTLGGAAAGLAGGVAGGLASGQTTKGKIGGALAGAASGLVRGGSQGFTGAKKGNILKGMSGAVSAQNEINKRKIAAAAAGSTLGGRMHARADQFFKGHTAADLDKEKVDDYKDAIDSAKSFKSVLADSAGKTDKMLDVDGRSVNLKQFKGVLAAANAGDKSAIAALKNYGFAKTVTKTTTDSSGRRIMTSAVVGDLAAANAGAAGFEKQFQKAYYNEITSNRATYASDGDAQAVFSAKDVADASLRGLDVGYTEVTADNAGTVIGVATGKSNDIKASESFKSNKANADAIKRGK